MEGEFLTILKGIIKQNNPELFLELLTASERVMIVRRIQIAKRLIENYNFDVIRRELNVGQATIESVEKWLSENFSEYQSILPSIIEDIKREAQEKRRRQPMYAYSFRWIRRKYPIHFYLLNLILDDINWNNENSKPQKPQTTPYAPKKNRSYVGKV